MLEMTNFLLRKFWCIYYGYGGQVAGFSAKVPLEKRGLRGFAKNNLSSDFFYEKKSQQKTHLAVFQFLK